VKAKEQYQIKISNRFAVSENFDDNMGIYTFWLSIRETIKTSTKENLDYYELIEHENGFMKSAQNIRLDHSGYNLNSKM
jgi:hypothetical protein